MLPSFSGGGGLFDGRGGGGGVYEGRGGGGGPFDGRGPVVAPAPPSFSGNNFIPIRLDSQDPEKKRIKEELVVRYF